MDGGREQRSSAGGTKPRLGRVRSARSAISTLVDGLRTGGGLRRLRTSASIGQDQVVVTRHLFLAAAVRLGVLPHLRRPTTAADLDAHAASDRHLAGIEALRLDRLEAWLEIGVTVGELGRSGDRYVVRGRRARTLADGDALLTSWYDGLATFGIGIPADLGALVAGTADRHDLGGSDASIAALAELTDPFVRPAVGAALAAVEARTVLDVGCGDGRLLGWMLDQRPGLVPHGIDQADGALDGARRRLGDRAAGRLHLGRLEDLAPTLGPFDVVTSANAVYYRPADELVAQIATLAALVGPGGELVVATAVRPETTTRARATAVRSIRVGAAVLDLQLRAQEGTLRLPTAAELVAAVAASGLTPIDGTGGPDGVPFLALRARRDR